jgi:hypothetical protein
LAGRKSCLYIPAIGYIAMPLKIIALKSNNYKTEPLFIGGMGNKCGSYLCGNG